MNENIFNSWLFSRFELKFNFFKIQNIQIQIVQFSKRICIISRNIIVQIESVQIFIEDIFKKFEVWPQPGKVFFLNRIRTPPILGASVYLLDSKLSFKIFHSITHWRLHRRSATPQLYFRCLEKHAGFPRIVFFRQMSDIL